MKPPRLGQMPRYWKPVAGVLAGTAWLAFVVTAVAPVVRDSLRGHREMGDLERRIVALGGWTGAKLLMERDLAENGPAIQAAWDRMYPGERGREHLFLELARIADESGVADFDLAEVLDLDLGPDEPDEPQVDDFDPMAHDDPYAATGRAQAVAATVELDSYRVKARWSGDYVRTAAFLEGLREIPRALSVESLAVRSYLKGIQVEMELEVFFDVAPES